MVSVEPVIPRQKLSCGVSRTYEEQCIYLCGNSLGLQPRRTADRIAAHLEAWATKGVFGHFKSHEDSELPPFVDLDEIAAQRMAPIVGAMSGEVAVMETLSANLHLMLASFYRPTKERFKIIIEGKAFPSDHYAVESQIRHHGLDPEYAMIPIEPPEPDRATIQTSHILSIIDKHASGTALILLPGIQYYTGQYLDILTITAHAHSHGITIGWDLAHAVGNVELQLHDWDVDFAVWCSYKYLNCGPGAIGGLFVHEKHGTVALGDGSVGYRPRLSGWWGGDKATRFQMGNSKSNMHGILTFLTDRFLDFVPIAGAAGFQVGNPCALAICPLLASLEIFALTSMSALRVKSVSMTRYLEELLIPRQAHEDDASELYRIITPSDPAQRGAQLSILLKPGLLEGVMAELEEQGVVIDERKPDVIRVAPAPLYNSFSDVWDFVVIFRKACINAHEGQAQHKDGSAAMAGAESKGWSHIK
ncbi:MAG: hypothetical protein LQ352_005573 [Teloschistes flavicans]|nr:MAG: hypothetical protein LQ352_005573 [Teloschistes flavicans]